MKYRPIVGLALAFFAAGCSVSALPDAETFLRQEPSPFAVAPRDKASIHAPVAEPAAPPAPLAVEETSVTTPPPAEVPSPSASGTVSPEVSEQAVNEEDASPSTPATASPAEENKDITSDSGEACDAGLPVNSETEARLQAVDKAVSELSDPSLDEAAVAGEEVSGAITEEDLPFVEPEEGAPPGLVVDDIEAVPPGAAWLVPDREPIKSVLREFTGPYHKTMQKILNRSGKHLPSISRILREEGLPGELAIVAMVESSFVLNAKSPSGAGGLWQFIPSTGKLYGLKVDWWVDQRMDPELSTRAAARHLKDLYAKFGDWELAIAAYNAGSGTISRALDRCRKKDFWGIAASGRLRRETVRYVPKLYAFLLISSDPAHYGFVNALEPEYTFDTVTVDAAVDFATIAAKSGVDKKLLEQLNPALLRGCTPPKTSGYPLRVPPGSAEAVSAAIAGLGEEEKLVFESYAVRQGDTFEKIAGKFGTTVTALLDLNRMDAPKKLKRGSKIAVSCAPGMIASVEKISREEGERLTHKVRRGDTVWGIARDFGVTAKEIVAWNSLGKKASIKPGDTLVVSKPGFAEEYASRGSQIYTVTRGDTISSIAKSKGVSIRNLLLWNSLESDSVIRPGDTLRLGPEAN
ncbi:LysM peptidoglycan-binding domain-containing protein [bacterium]|nr:MAG: LysM peptidoglycan-binding domain-containing protein [bacterium]